MLIRQVNDDMRDCTLARVVWVADLGFTSAENSRYLRAGDQHYLVGEKLRSGSAEADAGLPRQGRNQDIAAKVKEVCNSGPERFVTCFNPDEAERDAGVRERMLAQLQEMIKDSDNLIARYFSYWNASRSWGPGLAGPVPDAYRPKPRSASATLTMVAASTAISAVAMASDAPPRWRPLSPGAGTLHTYTLEQFVGAPGPLAGWLDDRCRRRLRPGTAGDRPDPGRLITVRV